MSGNGSGFRVDGSGKPKRPLLYGIYRLPAPSDIGKIAAQFHGFVFVLSTSSPVLTFTILYPDEDLFYGRYHGPAFISPTSLCPVHRCLRRGVLARPSPNRDQDMVSDVRGPIEHPRFLVACHWVCGYMVQGVSIGLRREGARSVFEHYYNVGLAVDSR